MGDTALLQSHCPFNMTIKQIKGHGNHRSMVIEKFVTHSKGSVQSSQLFFFDPFKTGYTARAPTSAVLNYGTTEPIVVPKKNDSADAVYLDSMRSTIIRQE